MTILVLGDQLTRRAGALADRPNDGVLMIESRASGRRLPYHPHKLVLVYSAMRHFRDELRAAGRDVAYRQADSFEAGLEAHFAAHPGDDLVLHASGHPWQ
ncbi:MAG: cryptochrome/photolyase family protein [Natrialbaceae archaeon]|nr:cryptochrome/photolyase family protein [Natrialbaceae archaeon]